MKKVVIFLLLVSVVAICNAQIVEKNSSGDYRVALEQEEWQKTGIRAEEEVWDYTEFFPEAIANPNSRISVEESERIVKMTGLFKALKEVEEKGIIFNSDENKITFIEPEKEEEESFVLIFAFVSVFFMLIANILFKIKNSFFAAAAAVAAAAAFVAAAAAAFVTAVTAAAFVTGDINNKGYKVFVIIYYIFMAAYFIFMFLGI